MVGQIAETVNANALVGEAIAVDICKSKNDPQMTPMMATPKAISKGNLIVFIIYTSFSYLFYYG